MYDNFTDRNNLLDRLDKLRSFDRSLAISKWHGCLSVLLNDPKMWEKLENYIKEYESGQPTLPLGLTDELINVVERVRPFGLDKDEKVVLD